MAIFKTNDEEREIPDGSKLEETAEAMDINFAFLGINAHRLFGCRGKRLSFLSCKALLGLLGASPFRADRRVEAAVKSHFCE